MMAVVTAILEDTSTLEYRLHDGTEDIHPRSELKHGPWNPGQVELRRYLKGLLLYRWMDG